MAEGRTLEQAGASVQNVYAVLCIALRVARETDIPHSKLGKSLHRIGRHPSYHILQ